VFPQRLSVLGMHPHQLSSDPAHSEQAASFYALDVQKNVALVS